jgi:hypothetical protein
MKIKKANIRRLASLSALGAGALGLSGSAEASSIVYSGILDEKVGFGRVTFAGPGGAGGMLKVWSVTGTCLESCGDHGVRLYDHVASHGTEFLFRATASGRGMVSAFSRNAKFGIPAHSKLAGEGSVVLAGYASSGPIQYTNFNVTDKYLLFEFTGGSLKQDLYGWAQLSVLPFAQVTLVDWAYDTSGAQIPAGDTGTPEPSTFALTGLAALALGAKGLRSWRAARKSAASLDSQG